MKIKCEHDVTDPEDRPRTHALVTRQLLAISEQRDQPRPE